MSRGKITLTLIIAAAMIIPAAQANWSGFGSYEPDTPQDESQGWMWQDASTSGDRIYFNGFSNIYRSGVNPNSGVTESRIEPAPIASFYAELGLWRDCNDDGYIGQVDSGEAWYRVETELNAAAVAANCPAGSKYNPDGAWILEFIAIGDLTDNYDANDDNDGATIYSHYINDSESRVWGDLGLPTSTSRSCPVNPRPIGTTSNTGVLLRYLDCGRGLLATFNDVDAALGTGLGFEDTNNPQKSDSPLNQDTPISTFGNPYAGDNNDEWQTGILQEGGDARGEETAEDRTFSVWDCNADPTFTQANPVENPDDQTIGDAYPSAVTVSGLAPSVNDDPTEASVLNAVNHTVNDAETHDGHPACDSEEGRVSGGSTTLVEDSFEGTSQYAGKNQADLNMQFDLGIGEDVFGEDDLLFYEEDDLLPEGDNLGPQNLAPQVFRGMPGLLGFGRVNFLAMPIWTATPNYSGTGLPVNSGGNLEDKDYVTFYAFVGDVSLQINAGELAASTTGTYGAEGCDGSTGSGAGISQYGWDCDGDNWYQPVDGTPHDEVEFGARPGDDYHLRDTDCYDGQVVSGQDIYTSAQYLFPADCDFAP